jgi:hypothetical protein
MQNHILIGLTVMLIGSTISTFLVHWLIVCPLLYKDGSPFPTGLLPWRMFRELNRYRDVLRARSESLSPYYIILLLRWFNLLLAVVVGLMWLTRYNSPPT